MFLDLYLGIICFSHASFMTLHKNPEELFCLQDFGLHPTPGLAMLLYALLHFVVLHQISSYQTFIHLLFRRTCAIYLTNCQPCISHFPLCYVFLFTPVVPVIWQQYNTLAPTFPSSSSFLLCFNDFFIAQLIHADNLTWTEPGLNSKIINILVFIQKMVSSTIFC